MCSTVLTVGRFAHAGLPLLVQRNPISAVRLQSVHRRRRKARACLPMLVLSSDRGRHPEATRELGCKARTWRAIRKCATLPARTNVVTGVVGWLAFLARASATSLPRNPMCSGTCRNTTSQPLRTIITNFRASLCVIESPHSPRASASRAAAHHSTPPLLVAVGQQVDLPRD